MSSGSLISNKFIDRAFINRAQINSLKVNDLRINENNQISNNEINNKFVLQNLVITNANISDNQITFNEENITMYIWGDRSLNLGEDFIYNKKLTGKDAVYNLLLALNRLDIGLALEAGLCISLIAILLDKMSLAWANKQEDYFGNLTFIQRNKNVLFLYFVKQIINNNKESELSINSIVCNKCYVIILCMCYSFTRYTVTCYCLLLLTKPLLTVTVTRYTMCYMLYVFVCS